jgi:predicted ATP-grasp superfamily ATP-dependent carboligase
VTIHRSVESLKRAMPPSDRPPAVVVGLCSHGLAIVRSLARKEIPVVAVESNWSQPSARTRYGLKLHHPDIHGPSLARLLTDLAGALPPGPVLFVTNDKMVRVVNDPAAGLRARYRLPFPRPELLLELIEKDTLEPLARRQGLHVPGTSALTAAEARGEEPSAALNEAAFPCVLKPAVPMSSLKAAIVRDREDVARIAATHRDIDRYLLQQWIEGDDERVVFAAWYFDREGLPRGAFAGQKIRQVPRTLGNSSAARGIDRPDLIVEGLRLFRGLDYHGIASVEFKLAPDGTPWFIEATAGRSDYWLKTMIVNGVDLPALTYSDLADVDLRASERQRNRAAWVDGDRDLAVYLESWSDPTIPKRRLVAQLFEPKRFALFDWRDLRPYAAWLGPLARRARDAAARRLAPARRRALPAARAIAAPAPCGDEATRPE